jgi:hypothetical protein
MKVGSLRSRIECGGCDEIGLHGGELGVDGWSGEGVQLTGHPHDHGGVVPALHLEARWQVRGVHDCSAGTRMWDIAMALRRFCRRGQGVRSGYGVALRDRNDMAQCCARCSDLRSDRIAR